MINHCLREDAAGNITGPKDYLEQWDLLSRHWMGGFRMNVNLGSGADVRKTERIVSHLEAT